VATPTIAGKIRIATTNDPDCQRDRGWSASCISSRRTRCSPESHTIWSFAQPQDSRAAVNLLSLIVRLVDPNRNLNPEPVNLNYGPTGEVEKELTPAEKWEWLRQLHEAFKDVRLPAAARSALFGDDDSEEGNGGNNAN
jgi:hypothetical protein